MKILIPMAGKGQRFNTVTFHSPKPLIEIDGKPMISHVVRMFSPDDEFIFICRQDHLEHTPMRKILQNLVQKCTIVSITTSAGGPLHGCKEAFSIIDEEEEVIVAYCDFTQDWSYTNFLKKVRTVTCDGAMASFRGFHPASLGDTYYCYLKTDNQQYITALQEKQPFSTEQRSKDYASTGVYYFKRGAEFKHYSQRVIDEKREVNGEAYVTLPYLLMLDDNKKILNVEIDKFICWGTPRDYEIYKFWSEFFFTKSGNVVGFNNVNIKTTNIFPLAGDARDFRSMGTNVPNYLIPVMNRPLISSTVSSHPQGIKNIFIALAKHQQEFNIAPLLQSVFSQPEILFLEAPTRGNAETLLHAKSLAPAHEPLCISGTSYILNYDQRRLSHLMEQDVDVILLTFSHHECVLRDASPHSFLEFSGGRVSRIAEKEVISNQPHRDHAFTGTAIYKKAEDAFWAMEKEMVRNPQSPKFLRSINELIAQGKKVVHFEVNKFVSLLNPTDLQEFVYWQEYFHKLPYHPYSKMVH